MTFFILNIALTMMYAIFLIVYISTRTRDTYKKIPFYLWGGIAVGVISVLVLFATGGALPSGFDAPPWSDHVIVTGFIALVLSWLALISSAMHGSFVYVELSATYRFPGPGIYVDAAQDICDNTDLDCYYKYLVIKVTKQSKSIFRPETLSWRIVSTHHDRAIAQKTAKHLCETPKPVFVGTELEKIC